MTLRVCLVRTAATIMLESPRSKVSLAIVITNIYKSCIIYSKVCAAWVSGVGATVNYDSRQVVCITLIAYFNRGA